MAEPIGLQIPSPTLSGESLRRDPSDETLISPPPTTANSHPSAFPVGREGSALFFAAPPPRPARRRPRELPRRSLGSGWLMMFQKMVFFMFIVRKHNGCVWNPVYV
ncbi:unnamed protein product [Musa acuminata var. zebrina]